MPQMAPLSWLYIPLMFIICMLLVMVFFWWVRVFSFLFEGIFFNSFRRQNSFI
uniref:ATP synthase F0 subunit 8 n=1 Tax=Nectonemertes cf. mirabilis HC-2011 TaxID=992350 RepID=I1SR53_9BILA|nr:ATP synthase F0 subunit 8 [Nectonemertes cf. mirabilis HC-2011]ADZ05373.1 ATP synthase F0 subunit 8 [Nectonemertes cf. mirabilis HC-2011]